MPFLGQGRVTVLPLKLFAAKDSTDTNKGFSALLLGFSDRV